MPRPVPNDAPESADATSVVSLGCRLNLAEGEAMRLMANEAGLGDCVIINSCAVTNEAVRQTRQAIRKARRDRPGARIIVTGCAAQIEPDHFANLGEVDLVLGNAEKMTAESWKYLAARAPGLSPEPAKIIVNDIMAARETSAHLIDGYGDRARAFLQVQNGCDHRCTFCIIPYGRGPSRSVSVAETVGAVRRLVASGHAEIVLTGVDMTSWGSDLEGAPKLGALVGAILDEVPDLFRLRLSSVDCAEIDGALFERLVSDDRLAPYLHLSLQAGSNLILKRMKRRHSREDAIRLAASLRARRPGFALGADFIAGFPTEDEAMFEDTLALIDEARIDFAHVFPFSPRNGTPAARMPQLDRSVVTDRARRLREKAAQATTRFLESLVGAEDDAVIESGGRARLGNFAAVTIGAGPCGDRRVARVRVTACEGETLRGELVG